MSNREACVNWIKDYFKNNPDGKAIIGISGGKDSTIAAALCVEALGADRVVGVLMPNEYQSDISDSYEVCSVLGIEYFVINIGKAYAELYDAVLGETFLPELPPIITTNTPARLRMTILYMVAGLCSNSRVVNTCNASEDYVGYSTKYGDAAGDFSPLGNLTVREVLEIGDELGLPEHLVHKAPSDGMCGKTDEDNLGFTYEQLDDHILNTGEVDMDTRIKIERLHYATRHKYTPMPMFDPTVPYINNDQLSIDNYADGGLVTPDLNAAAMNGRIGVNPMKEFDGPAAINIDFNVNKADIQRITENITNALNAEISFYGRR